MGITALTIKGASDLDDAQHDAFKDVVYTSLEEAIGSAEGLSMDAGAELAVTGELLFELLDDPAHESPNIILHLTLTLDGADAHGDLRLVAESWAAIEPLQSEVLEDVRRRAARTATSELARQLQVRGRVLTADQAGLGVLLADPNPRVIQEAIYEVRRRGRTDLMADVTDLLVHFDKDVVLTALAAVEQMGGEESVTLVQDLVASPDPDKVERAVFALGALGGERAKAALAAVAQRHPEPAVRRLAAEMLARIKKRERAGATP